MSNATFELPNTEEISIDGYKIDLSTGVLGGQALIYDVGSNSFIATTLQDAYGSLSGSFINGQVAFAAGAQLLNGSDNFTFDGYNISVGGDGYFIGRLIMNASSSAVSASGTGAFRFNTATNHIEFSENGGSWTQIGAGTVTSVSNSDSTLTISPTTGAVVASLNLGNANTWSAKQTFSSHIAVDGYTFDLSTGATNGQVLTYNGTSFVAQNPTGGISGTLTNTKIPYATGTSTLADSGMAWDDTNKILTITTLAGNDGVAVTDGTRSLGLFVNYNSAAVGALGTTSNHNLVFFTNSQAAQMTLNTSGNLGIGVSPGYKLDVNGDIHISANRLLIDASSASVSPSGMGAIRFNTSNNHLEFSENGGSWTAFGTGTGGSSGGVVNQATNKELLLTTTSATTVVTYTPTGDSNFAVLVYYRVITATTTLTLTLTWTDTTGAQTQTVLNAQSQTIGSYLEAPIYINATTSTPITLTATAGTANQVYISADIVEYAGAVVSSNTLTTANTWTAKQTFSNHIAIDGYTIDLSAGATTNQVLQYNGTSFVAGTVSGGGMSIGGTVTSGTSGSILFVDSSGNLAQNNTALFWNNTNKVLKITQSAADPADGTGAITLQNTLSTSVSQITWRDHNGTFKAAFGYANAGGTGPYYMYIDNGGLGLNYQGPGGLSAQIYAGVVNQAGFQLWNGSSLGTSTSSTGRLIYNSSSQKFQASLNTGAYGDVLAGNGLYFNPSTIRVGIGTAASTPSYALDIRDANSGGECIAIRNSTVSGYSDLVWFDSSNTQKGGIGWGNASVGATTLQSRNFFYTPNLDWVMSDGTTNFFRWYNGSGAIGFELSAGNSATTSVSNTGKIRYNSSTQHFEISENGNAYVQMASGGAVTIGGAVTSGTNNRVLYVDGSGNLGDTILSITSSELAPVSNGAVSLGDSSHKFADGYFSGKINLDGYNIDLSAGATSGQVLQYNGTAFIAAASSGVSEFSYSLRDYYDNLATGKAAGSSNEVHGSMFYLTTAFTVTGAQFYWGDTQSKTVRVKLWSADGTQRATVDVAVNGAGWYTATFSSPYSASAYTAYVVSHWETGGTLSWKFNMRGSVGSTPANNFDPYGWNGTNGGTPATWQAGAHFWWMSWSLWGTGDVIPGTSAGTERYAIEPVFTVP